MKNNKNIDIAHFSVTGRWLVDDLVDEWSIGGRWVVDGWSMGGRWVVDGGRWRSMGCQLYNFTENFKKYSKIKKNFFLFVYMKF